MGSERTRSIRAASGEGRGGVIMLTRHVAREYGPLGVRVNRVAPATTLSPRVEKLMTDELRADIAAMRPLGRLGAPDDSAHATAFLLSEAAAWHTGVTLDVAGGRVML